MSRRLLAPPAMVAVDRDGDLWVQHGDVFHCLTQSDNDRTFDDLQATHGPVTLYAGIDADFHQAEAERLIDLDDLDGRDQLEHALRLGRAAVHALLVIGAGLRALRRPS